MLVVHRKPFLKGLILLISFIILVWVMMMPIFRSSDGTRQNSLQYADTVFNELSKGSSFFIPQVLETVKELPHKDIRLTIKMTRPELAALAVAELKKGGMTNVEAQDGEITFSGALVPVLHRALEDATYLYSNDGDAIKARYDHAEPLQVARAWWYLLNPAIKELQKQKHFQEAAAVEQVVRKAIEPGNNFYGLPSANVAENALLVCAMLTFYVLYAIWYGFAIYNLFDGLGLLGSHAKTA